MTSLTYMVVSNIEYSWVFQPCVPEVNVLAGTSLFNQRRGSLYFTVSYFQYLTHTCISESVCHKLPSAALWFLHTLIPCLSLTGSRYHAQLKVTALFDREMVIFLRISFFFLGCSLKWSGKCLFDVISCEPVVAE